MPNTRGTYIFPPVPYDNGFLLPHHWKPNIHHVFILLFIGQSQCILVEAILGVLWLILSAEEAGYTPKLVFYTPTVTMLSEKSLP